VPPPSGPPPGVTTVAPGRRRVLRVELATMAFLAVVPSFVLSLRGITDPTDIDLDIPVVELLAALLAALGPGAMALYLLWRDGMLRSAGFDRRPLGFVAGYGALGWVCCWTGLVTVGIVINAVILATGGDLTEPSDESSFELTVGTAAAGLALALVAGIGEEIVFRAYAITRMEEAGYGRAAVWVPWAVFTVVHLYQGLVALLVIGVVGGVFTWLYLWKRSVWPVMVAHALYDIGILALAAAVGS
jgi:membrane protease YdiL (CAAX protease family)